MIKKEIKSLLKSFKFAFKGISYCIHNERNMRIHISAAIVVSIFAFFYGVTRLQMCVLAICICGVISAEMINTALETLTNLESPSYNNLARIAKDVAAGAVLFWAMVSLIVGAGIFFQKEKFLATIVFFLQNPIILIIYLAIILLLIIFVFKGIKINKEYVKIYNMKNSK